MRKNSLVYAVSLVVILVVIIGYFFFYSFFNVSSRFAQGSDVFLKGTSVVGIDLEGKSYEQAKMELQEKVDKWKEQQQLSVSFEGEENKVPSSLFRIDIEASLERAKGATGISELVVHVQENILLDVLMKYGDHSFHTYIDVEKLSRAMEEEIKKLHVEKTSIDLQQFVKGEQKEEVVSTVTISIPSKYKKIVEYWTGNYEHVKLEPNNRFSFLHAFIDKESTFTNEEWSFISSTMMKAILPTNFEIIERHTGRELSHDSDFGYEAKVVKSELDFSFIHHNSTFYRMESSVSKDELTMKVIGQPFLYTYKYVVKEKATYEPKVEKRQVASLPVGTIHVKQQGKQGASGKVVREKYTKSGLLVSEEQVFDDFYPPTRSIIEEGTAPLEVEASVETKELQNKLEILEEAKELQNKLEAFIDKKRELQNKLEELKHEVEKLQMVYEGEKGKEQQQKKGTVEEVVTDEQDKEKKSEQLSKTGSNGDVLNPEMEQKSEPHVEEIQERENNDRKIEA